MGSRQWLRRHRLRDGAGWLIRVKWVDIFRPLVGLSTVDMTAQVLEAAIAGQRYDSLAWTQFLGKFDGSRDVQSR